MKNRLNFYINYIGPTIILLFILSAPFFLVPYYNDLQKLEATLRMKEKEVEDEKDRSLKIDEAYNKLLEYQPELKKIESAFPERDLIIPEFNNFIKQEVTYSGIILNGIGSGVSSPVEGNPSLEKTTFSVSLTGSYPVLKNFLSTLYSNARLVSVDSISIASTGDDGLFQINALLGIYSYKR